MSKIAQNIRFLKNAKFDMSVFLKFTENNTIIRLRRLAFSYFVFCEQTIFCVRDHYPHILKKKYYRDLKKFTCDNYKLLYYEN